LACDQRLFSTRSSVSFSEAKVGLPLPQCIASELRNAVTSHGAFYDMAVLGRALTAEAALACGYASSVYKSETELQTLITDHAGKVSTTTSAIAPVLMLISGLQTCSCIGCHVVSLLRHVVCTASTSLVTLIGRYKSCMYVNQMCSAWQADLC
jgi:enoyl-CoA hydratase/carnithine racemase